jgi:hypothetical protein
MTLDYWRQADLVSPTELSFALTLVGAGGIGSALALALAKMGCQRLTVFDPDRVEPHNLPNQLYRLGDVGRPKVEALRDLLAEMAGIAVDARAERIGSEAGAEGEAIGTGAGRRLQGVVLSAVDSMASRQAIWSCVRFRAGVPLYIDARMGAEVCRVFSVRPADPDDVRAYEATLYDDAAATEDPCTARAIVYTTLGVAALVANQVKRFARGEPLTPDVIFDFATLSLLAEPS